MSTMDSLQRIMTSFKNFEKKLDKLQNDVNAHGETLAEVRSIVARLSDNGFDEELRPKDSSRFPIGSAPYEGQYIEEPVGKRKDAIQPLPNKLKANFDKPQHKKYGIKSSSNGPAYRTVSSPKGTLAGKHSRLRKTEPQRKANTVRSQKTTEKKRKIHK